MSKEDNRVTRQICLYVQKNKTEQQDKYVFMSKQDTQNHKLQ